MVVAASLAADSMSLVAMGVRACLLLVLCLLGAGAGMAQSLPLPSPPSPPPPQTTVAPPPKPPPFGRTMSTVITVSISVFFFLLFFCAYINQCRFAQVDGPPGGPGAAATGGGPFRRGKRGLDPAVVATFPIVPYREIKEHKIGRGVLECAVCLTEFEECDDLRLLPHCSHAFHPECIDPWLEVRVTCPLCRTNLEKPMPALAPVAPPSPEQVAPRQPSPSPSPLPSPPHAVAVGIPVQGEGEDNDEEDRQEEAIELEMLRSERRAARLPKAHSTGHSLFAASAAAVARNDHERFTLRLPHHVREQVLRSRHLRHATSLIDLSGMSPEGSSRGGRRAGGSGISIGIGIGNGGKRWQSFLARTMSWARVGGDGSVRKGWDGSTRRGKDGAESSTKGAASPATGRP